MQIFFYLLVYDCAEISLLKHIVVYRSCTHLVDWILLTLFLLLPQKLFLVEDFALPFALVPLQLDLHLSFSGEKFGLFLLLLLEG